MENLEKWLAEHREQFMTRMKGCCDINGKIDMGFCVNEALRYAVEVQAKCREVFTPTSNQN